MCWPVMVMLSRLIFFFFSSRRRHTRLQGDWSSDVCSSDLGGIYLHAGPEIGVASTKAFTCQIVALALLGLYLGRERGLSEERGRELAGRLIQLPQLVRSEERRVGKEGRSRGSPYH